MNSRRALVLAAAFTCGLMTSSSAHAQYGGPFGYGGYWDVGRLYRVLANNVPYYSAFPPVYYSYPVPRPYGFSPFAYLPHVQTPSIGECAQPEEITNPYAPSSDADAEETAAEKTTALPSRSVPLVVFNPYVTSAKGDSTRALASVQRQNQ